MVLCDQGPLLKVLAHAAKFPSHSVNGVLLGSVGANGVEVHDAVPLCHTTLALAPALEIGLAQVRTVAGISERSSFLHYPPTTQHLSTYQPVLIVIVQVEAYTSISGSTEIVGYYHSEARYAPGDLPPLGRKVADKLADRQPRAVALVLDNKKLEQFCKGQADNPFDLFNKDGARGWKRAGGAGSAAAEGEAGSNSGLQLHGSDWKKLREEFFTMFKQLKHRTLADFEEHLDDPTRDWLNKSFAGKFTLPGNAL